MEINESNKKLKWLYSAGFFVILVLPLFNLPPWLYPPDFAKSIILRSILALMLFGVLWALLGKKDGSYATYEPKKVLKNPIFWALGALFGVFLLASIFSVDPNFSFWGSPYRGGGFITFAFYFFFALLTFVLFKKENWQQAWIVSISAGIAVCAIALFQFYGLFNNVFVSVASRPGSTIGNPIFLGIYLLLLLFPTLVFALKEQNKKLRIFYGASTVLFLVVILITGSRAAYLGLIAGAIILALFYPKKIKWLKTGVSILLLFIILAILYVNLTPQFPKTLSENRLFQSVAPRLSLKDAFANERYRAWITAWQEIKDRPVLGWGPENLAVGFDKFYDPKITWSPWWDKAHNIFLDIGAQAGILGILAYIALFFALFWQLHRIKKITDDQNKKIIVAGLQAVLSGYLVANFFSFDSFATYLIFFLIIGYVLHLSWQDDFLKNAAQPKHIIKGRKIIIVASTIVLVVFLWQYNIVPFQVNAKLNTANNMAENGKCDKALVLFEKAKAQHSYADSYLIMQYVNGLKKCAEFYPANNLEYAKKGLFILEEGVKIQPLYTRYWLYIGSFTAVVANQEQDQKEKQALINKAYYYFDKASQLSPGHAEILLEKSKAAMVAGDYKKMNQNARDCILANSTLKECDWMLVLSEIYSEKPSTATTVINNILKEGLGRGSITHLYNLVNAFDTIKDYSMLAKTYELLIKIDNGIPQYYSSLAFTYAQVGEYGKAREYALEFLRLMPQAKDEVDAFLRTLPY